jgi:hypothetical protein
MNPSTIIAAATLFAALPAAPLAAQVFARFGAACIFEEQKPSIDHVGLPHVGRSFLLTYRGPNFTFMSSQQIAWPQLAIGFAIAPIVIPPDFLPQQPEACTGYITVDLLIPAELPSHNFERFRDRIEVRIPNVPALAGTVFFAQWLLEVDQCGFAGCGHSALITSDAAILVIGP